MNGEAVFLCIVKTAAGPGRKNPEIETPAAREKR